MQERDTAELPVNTQLLTAAIRFNALILGLTGGALAALVTFIATHISMAKWSVDAGSYLGLLAVFFPGYSVTGGGAWVGAFWAFVYASVFGWLSYHLYGRTLGARLADLMSDTRTPANPVLKPQILRLHGLSLGLALGCTIALGLFLSTSWLVIRGTANESTHAALLANYLPGYSVSFLGALLGALALFAMAFLGSLLLAAIYNSIVDFRHGRAGRSG
jgi:hypothetical protein